MPTWEELKKQYGVDEPPPEPPPQEQAAVGVMPDYPKPYPLYDSQGQQPVQAELRRDQSVWVGENQVGIHDPQTGTFKETVSPEAQRRQTWQDMMRQPSALRPPVKMDLPVSGGQAMLPREQAGVGEVFSKYGYPGIIPEVIEKATGLPLTGPAPDLTVPIPSWKQWGLWFDWLKGKGKTEGFQPAQLTDKEAREFLGWAGITAPAMGLPTATAGWKALATAPTAAKIAGRTALAPLVAAEQVPAAVLKYGIILPVTKGVPAAGKKALELALSTGLDKWFAAQGRKGKAASILWRTFLTDENQIKVTEFATNNLTRRLAEKRGVQAAAKMAAKDTIKDIEPLLLEAGGMGPKPLAAPPKAPIALEVTPESLGQRYGVEVEIVKGQVGGKWAAGVAKVGDDITPMNYKAGDWTSRTAADFVSSKKYPANVVSASHEIAHGLFTQNPEKGQVVLQELQKLGVPKDVAFESLVDLGGLYLLEPAAITKTRLRGVIETWLSKSVTRPVPVTPGVRITTEAASKVVPLPKIEAALPQGVKVAPPFPKPSEVTTITGETLTQLSRSREIKELLATPATKLPKGTTKIAMRQELTQINKVLKPAEKKLRGQIMAAVSEKSLPQNQFRQIFRDVSGKRQLSLIDMEHLPKILDKVRAARPVSIRGKKVIKLETENKIQSLRATLIKERTLDQLTFESIKKYLGLKTDRFEHSGMFISDSEGKSLIREMLNEADVGYVAWTNRVADAVKSNPELGKDIEALMAQRWSDDPGITRSIAHVVRSLTWKKLPEGADVSGLWSARYRFELLGIRTKDPRWHWLERAITERAHTAEYNVMLRQQELAATPYFKEVAADAKAQQRITDYIASKLEMKGAPEAPADIKPYEIEMAKAIEKLLFSYRPEVRYNRFVTWYDHFDGNVAQIMTKIKDAPRADIVEAIKIYESKGASALRQYLDTKEWGIIKSGYEPHIAVNPKLVDYHISEAVIGKGKLASREGLIMPTEDNTLFKRVESYMYYMERLKLRPLFHSLSRVYHENLPKLANPGKIKYQLEGFMAEAKGGRPLEHPALRIMGGIASVAYNAIFKMPHLSFRNLFQAYAFSRDKTIFTDLRNKKLPKDVLKLFKIQDSQMKGARRDLLLYEQLGSGRVGRFLKATDHYPYSDEGGRLQTFWGYWNKADRAMAEYKIKPDFQQFLKASALNELTIQQQVDIAERMVMKSVSYADGAIKMTGEEAAVYEIASNFAKNVHFVYDRIGRSTWEYGPEGKVLTSLFVFPRSYAEQLYLLANRIRPGSKADTAAKLRAWKGIFAVIVGGTLVGAVYEKVAGKTRNPYNPLNILTYTGGIAVSLSVDVGKGIYLMVQAAQGQEWAQAELTTHLPRMADTFLPFYAATINALEALTDTQYIDRLALRKLRAAFDKEYMPSDEYYIKERGIIGQIQHALFGGEEPGPKAVDAARMAAQESVDQLGKVQEAARAKALEGVVNEAMRQQIWERNWTYTTGDLYRGFGDAIKGIDAATLMEPGFPELMELYLESQPYIDYYYQHTDEGRKYLRESGPYYNAYLYFWGRVTALYGDDIEVAQREAIVRGWMREYEVPEEAIPALIRLAERKAEEERKRAAKIARDIAAAQFRAQNRGE